MPFSPLDSSSQKIHYRYPKLLNYFTRKSKGFNLVQTSLTITILGILAAISVPSISLGTNPLSDTGNRVKSQIKLARTKAISTTSAVRIKPISNQELAIQLHQANTGTTISSCADANVDTDSNGKEIWKNIRAFNSDDYQFEKGVILTSVRINGANVSNLNNWSLCFDSRGISNNSISIGLEYANETIELNVFRGGAITIQ